MDARDKLRCLSPVRGDLARLWWLFYLSGEGNERASADELLDVVLFQSLDLGFREDVFLPPPVPDDCAGEYFLGRVLYPPRQAYSVFGLREHEWIRHVLVVGMTGTGKTNLVFHVLSEFRRHQRIGGISCSEFPILRSQLEPCFL
jgi:hypothetical protein